MEVERPPALVSSAGTAGSAPPIGWCQKAVPLRSYVRDLRYVRARGARVRARVDRQAGSRPPDRGDCRRWDRPASGSTVDKKSGATVDRPSLRAILEYAREGDVIVVHTLDRLGRTVRDTRAGDGRRISMTGLSRIPQTAGIVRSRPLSTALAPTVPFSTFPRNKGGYVSKRAGCGSMTAAKHTGAASLGGKRRAVARLATSSQRR